MLTPEALHPLPEITPPRAAPGDDGEADGISRHVATMPDPAAAEGPSNLPSNGVAHNEDLDADGSDREDDTGWPNTLLAVRSLMALARKPRVYQRVNVEPKPVLPPRVRKRPIKVEDGLVDNLGVPPPHLVSNLHRRAPFETPVKQHHLRARKSKFGERVGADDGEKDQPPRKRPVKVPRKRLSLNKPKEQVPARRDSSPLTVIDEPWHYDPFGYLTPEERETRGGFMRVLNSYRAMDPYPKHAQLQAARHEVQEFHRLNPGQKLANLGAETTAIFLASVSARRTSTQHCPCDPLCKETQSNFLGVRRHILSHSVFHLHCMAKDPKTGAECNATVLGGRTSALMRHLRIHHQWEQWQIDEIKLVDGFACWPQWACTIVHPPDQFTNRTLPSKGR
ncbi:hypothetical protein AURDEDRAFT_146850 [Auricularia subglabra TFB-10046 SS5]|nr:hypothetical protein AURDEDRAFT_146850 [Auricularia subglabra TFB-10046 SS5]